MLEKSGKARCDEMVDSQLKAQMEQALIEGRQEDALILSRKLDVQIVQATKRIINFHGSTSYSSYIEGSRHT